MESSDYKYCSDTWQKYSAFLVDEYNRMLINAPDRDHTPTFESFCDSLMSVYIKITPND
jgi:hypothetical protein